MEKKKKSITEMSPNELRRYPLTSLTRGLGNLKVKNAMAKAALKQRIKNVGHSESFLFSGNVGDLTSIIWPFWFQTEITQVDPDSVQTTNINITQEAAFCITHLSLAVMEVIVTEEVAEIPATVSVETLTFSDNNLNGHVLDFNGNTITLGVDVAIGGDLDTTLASLQAYMNGTDPFQGIYVAASIGGGGGVFTVTTIEVGDSANENNAFVYIYPNADQDRLDSTGFIGGADLVAAVAASTSVRYINPKDQSDAGLLGALNLEIIDSQSSRSWHDEPVPASIYGDALDPFILENPYMILQNQNIEVRWTNNTQKILIPTLLFHGYRIRLKDSEGIMSLVTE